MCANCESEHPVAIIGIILKKKWEQGKEIIRGAAKEEM